VIEPTNGLAEYYLADTLVKMKQVNDALPHYATALGLAPDSKEGIEAEAALRKFLSTIAAARAASMALAAQAETALWRAAQGSGSVQDYQTYLRRYPKGQYVPLANSRIDALNAEADRRQQAAAEEQRRVAAIAAEARRQETRNHLQCSFGRTMNGNPQFPAPAYPQLYIDVIGAQHVRLADADGTREIVSGQPDPQNTNAPWTVSVTDDLINYSDEHTEHTTQEDEKDSFQTTVQRQTGQYTQVFTATQTWFKEGKTIQLLRIVYAGTCMPRP
jgi:hypothetical protein